MANPLRFFAHHVIGVVGSISSVIVIPLAIVFYLKTIEVRQLVYVVDPIRTTIVNAQENSLIKVLFKGEELGNTPVTAAHISIWNEGRKSIRPENVLEPVTAVVPDGVRILDVRLVKSSRTVTDFRVDDRTSRYDEGRVAFTWNILEQNDGATFQVTFAGGGSTEIGLLGTIEGSPGIHAYSEQLKKHGPRDRLLADYYRVLAIGGGAFVLPWVGLVVSKRLRARGRLPARSTDWIFRVLMGLAALQLMVMLLSKNRVFRAIVPF
jgi:hypothetical protein